MTRHKLQVIVNLLGKRNRAQAPYLYKIMDEFLSSFAKPLRGPYPNHVNIRMNQADTLCELKNYAMMIGVRGLRKTAWYRWKIPY